ncbi:MAG: SAM-dependent methyltransferase [Pseudomonadota bacterium]
MSPPPIEPPAIPPGYLVKQQTVTGAGASLQVRSLLDRQQYYDPLGEAAMQGISDAQWPLFGLIWPTGRVLSLAMQTYEIDGRRVLELGCGLALASLIVHRRGGDITASDCHPLAGEFLIENLKLNGMLPMKYELANWGRANPALGLFDVIIGSDVLYDRDQPEVLSQFIDRHSAATVEVLIADPDRGNQSPFSRKMAVLGYAHSEQRVTSLPADGGPYKGRLHSYRRTSFGM